MSLKENNLTDIKILPYDEKWGKIFQSIEEILKSNLDDLIICVEHIGSTSVKDLEQSQF